MVAQYGKETIISNGNESDVITWSGGAHCALPSLKFYGLSEQYVTPTPESPAWIYGFTGPCMVHNGPYFNTPPLHGIGEYKDEWDYVTGKGVRRVASITFDGVSEGKKVVSGSIHSSGYSLGQFRFEYESVDGRLNPILSTHFKAEYVNAPGCMRVQESSAYGNRLLYMFHTDQTLDTTAKWNAWLAEQYANGTPVTIYYTLAEPQPFEERPDYAPYQPIPNDSGSADIIDGGMNTPFEVSYITHSSGFKKVTVSSNSGTLEWSGGLSCSLPSLKLYGAMKYSNTPTPDNPVTFYFNDGNYLLESTNGFSQTITVPELKAVGVSWYGYIRDELDYITGEGLRRIHKVVMDGESEYGKVRNAGFNSLTNCYYAIYYPQYPQLQNGVYHINSTHFDSRWEVTHGKIYANNTSNMYFCHDSLTTVDEWNAWFKEQYDAGTPVTIYYALAEPQPFEVQGNTLPNAGGRIQFSNTNITTPPPFELTYITKS